MNNVVCKASIVCLPYAVSPLAKSEHKKPIHPILTFLLFKGFVYRLLNRQLLSLSLTLAVLHVTNVFTNVVNLNTSLFHN